MKPDPEIVSSGLEKSFSWLDKLAWATLAFTSAIFVARVMNQVEFTFSGIKFPIWAAHVGISLITAAHFFIMRHVVISAMDAWKNLNSAQRIAIFERIVRTGGILTKGAVSYRDALSESKNEISIKTNIADPPTWVHIALVSLVFLALVDIDLSLLSVAQFCFALIFCLINWKIGESWLLCLGDLGSFAEQSSYFADDNMGARYVSYTSGVVISENLKFRRFLLASIIEAFVSAVMLWVILLVPFSVISLIIWFAKGAE